MSPSGLILKPRLALAAVRLIRIAVAVVIIGLLTPSGAQAQNYEPVGVEGAVRVAVDRSVTFRRDDDLMQTVLLEVPRARRGGVRYALVAARFDCQREIRTMMSRTWFSARRDPFQTIFDPPEDVGGHESAAVEQQLRAVCGSRPRIGSVTLQQFVDGRE